MMQVTVTVNVIQDSASLSEVSAIVAAALEKALIDVPVACEIVRVDVDKSTF